MSTRLIGAACEAAQNSPYRHVPPLPATLMLRFDMERQKFTSPVQPRSMHRVYTSIVPFTRDIARRAAEPAHLGVVAELDVQRGSRGSVRSGHEEKRVALRAELARDLLIGDSHRRSA